jgi:phage tail protein X
VTDIITKDGDMADRLCFNWYGTHDGGVLEAMLEANPILARYGLLLPAGLALTMPRRPASPLTLPVSLWD